MCHIAATALTLDSERRDCGGFLGLSAKRQAVKPSPDPLARPIPTVSENVQLPSRGLEWPTEQPAKGFALGSAQVVDGRRAMRDAIVAALARRLPRHFVKATGRMQAFRVVHLSFDQCTFSQVRAASLMLPHPVPLPLGS